jgi:hypothetical protein
MKASRAVSHTSFALAFAYFVVFNILDLSSTILALKLGLSEANFVLVYLSSSLGIGITDVIVLVKSVFFVGVGALVILGIATRNQGMKRKILFTIILFGAVFALVLVNNFFTIYSVISA